MNAPDDSLKPRFRRPPPERLGPRRSPFLDAAYNGSRYSASAGKGRVNEDLYDSVTNAYSVVEEHIREGQEAAARHQRNRQRSAPMYQSPFQAMGMQQPQGFIPVAYMQQWMHAMQTWMNMWMSMLPAMTGGMMPPMPPGMAPMPGMGPMSGMSPGMAPGMSPFGPNVSGPAPPSSTGGMSGEPPPGAQAENTMVPPQPGFGFGTHASVAVLGDCPAEVIVSIAPCVPDTELQVDPLHGEGVDAPALTATVRSDAIGRLEVRVTVMPGQPPGGYRGVVHGPAGEALGELAVIVRE